MARQMILFAVERMQSALNKYGIHKKSEGCKHCKYRRRCIFEFRKPGSSEAVDIEVDLCKIRYTGMFQPPGVDADVGNLLFDKALGLTRKVDDDQLPSLDETIKHIEGKEFVFFLNEYKAGFNDDDQERAHRLSQQRLESYLSRGWIRCDSPKYKKEWWNLPGLICREHVEARLVARLLETLAESRQVPGATFLTSQ